MPPEKEKQRKPRQYKHFLVQYVGDPSSVAIEPEYGYVEKWSMRDILKEINRDHSSQWIDYDRSDWKEGLTEWTDYRPFAYGSVQREFYVFAIETHVRDTNGNLDYIRVYANGELGAQTEYYTDKGVSSASRVEGRANADKFDLDDALRIAKKMNSSQWAKTNGYKFRVYPCGI